MRNCSLKLLSVKGTPGFRATKCATGWLEMRLQVGLRSLEAVV